jgi:serine/threonine protein phosphatase PrpC
LFAAVADGAGTAKFSAKGAKLAVHILGHEIQLSLAKYETNLTEEILKSAVIKTSHRRLCKPIWPQKPRLCINIDLHDIAT